MGTVKTKLTVVFLFLFVPTLASAEIIVLKSGKTMEGKLIEKTDKYIKIDFQGVPLTYYFDEIQSIDGEEPCLSIDKNVLGDKESALFNAIKNDDVKEVEQVIKAGADVNARNNGVVPLAWAASGCHKEIVELLLANGAEVNARDTHSGLFRGMTPLMWAVHRCKKDIVELFLAKGADIGIKDNSGKTAWLWSVVGRDKEIVELLLTKGVDINERDNSGATALMGAAGAGNKEIVELLLSRGADINAKNNHGATAIVYAERYAEKYGKKDIVLLLAARQLNYNESHTGFNFNPPKGWQKNVTDSGLSVSYYQPEKKANILITPPYPASNSDFANLLSTMRKQGKLISEDKKELLGTTCYILTYEMPNSTGAIFRIKAYIFFKSGKVFTIVYMASPFDFKIFLPDFEISLSSFNVE